MMVSSRLLARSWRAEASESCTLCASRSSEPASSCAGLPASASASASCSAASSASTVQGGLLPVAHATAE
jgi:hypothetical protein